MELVALVFGIAAGAIGVYQFVVPQAREEGVEEGRRLIAAEVVKQLQQAGVSISPEVTSDPTQVVAAVATALKPSPTPVQDSGIEMELDRTYFLSPAEIPVTIQSLTSSRIPDWMFNGEQREAIDVGETVPFPSPADNCVFMIIDTNYDGGGQRSEGKVTATVRCR